jgi:hypothetical protein
MQLIKDFDMPSPMNFLNEGGVTLGTDASKFYAVSPMITFLSFLFQKFYRMFFRVLLICG